MSEKCLDAADLELLLDATEAGADANAGAVEARHHLEKCAECRVKLTQYRSFMSEDRAPVGADRDAAELHLGAFIAREIAEAPITMPGPAGSPSRPRSLRRWSPVLIAACLVFVAVLVNDTGDDQQGRPSGVVRDATDAISGLNGDETPTAEGFVLRWPVSPEADTYQVVVLDAAMVEIERFTTDLSGEYRLDRGQHPWLQNKGPFLWYVTALRDGDEIARSSMRALGPSP
jgi:hypothetical protein